MYILKYKVSYFFIFNTYMYYSFIPYLSILRYNVEGLILSIKAAFDLFPLQECNALIILCFSFSSSLNGSNGSSVVFVCIGGDMVMLNEVWSISLFFVISTARLILFCNSLIFPDQLCERSSRSASDVKPVVSLCSSSENLLRKNSASGRMSSGQSRSDVQVLFCV